MSTTTPCLNVRGLNYCKNNITQIYYDGKIRPSSDCSLSTCSLLVSHWGYLPNKPGNYFFLALFLLILMINIPLGLWKRMWTVMVAITLGCLLEAIGTIGRVLAADQPFKFNPFLIYIIFLTIGPAFLSAAIYLCLSRIIVVYGESNSRFKPKTYSVFFMVSDFICLVLQGGGGGLAATAKDDKVKAQKGINVMLAGLAWQVASLTLFAIAAADFAWRVRHGKRPSKYQSLTSTRRFRGFIWALGIATATIYIRSVYRVAELSEGFTGRIANMEIPYMFLEPVMIVIACTCLTVWHPSYVFGDLWRTADYRLNSQQDMETILEKGGDVEKDLPSRPVSRAFSTVSSESNLSIQIFPDRERKASNWSTNSRWYIAHQPSCPHHNNSRRPSRQTITTFSGSSSYSTRSHQASSPPQQDVPTHLLRPNVQFSSVDYLGSQQEIRRPSAQRELRHASPHQGSRYLTTQQNPRQSMHSPKTAPLMRPADYSHISTWTSAHQPVNPKTATVPRTPRGLSPDDRMEW